MHAERPHTFFELFCLSLASNPEMRCSRRSVFGFLPECCIEFFCWGKGALVRRAAPAAAGAKNGLLCTGDIHMTLQRGPPTIAQNWAGFAQWSPNISGSRARAYGRDQTIVQDFRTPRLGLRDRSWSWPRNANRCAKFVLNFVAGCQNDMQCSSDILRKSENATFSACSL